jgi:hypothetical protein
MTRGMMEVGATSANIGNRLDSTGFHRDPGFGGFDMEVGQEACRRRAPVRFSPPAGVGHGGFWARTLTWF